ncbi:MAG: hypothetical protein EBT77_01480 [Verrucomicrobia bacterium]|nr:hypothetical protein [Verrucomicrobiota bacterium]
MVVVELMELVIQEQLHIPENLVVVVVVQAKTLRAVQAHLVKEIAAAIIQLTVVRVYKVVAVAEVLVPLVVM